MQALTDKIKNLCSRRWQCGCGREHAISTQEVIISYGAMDVVPELVDRLFGGGSVGLVADEITDELAGQRVAHTLCSKGRKVIPIIFSSPLEATDARVTEVVSKASPHLVGLVAVGAGTINDITKSAAEKCGVRYIVVATAPSQNGYASPIAALKENGIKVTRPAKPPVAVVADTTILSQAPRSMISAGFADLLGRSTASADWLLTHLLKGEYYCEEPLAILSEAERACRRNALAIGRGETEAVELLMAALVLSSFSMVVAGSSAPASGGEHLVSHYLDFREEWHPKRSAAQRLHGIQVGVATLLMTRLYERLLALAAADIEAASLRGGSPEWGEEEKHIRRQFDKAAEAALQQFRRKFQPWKETRKNLGQIAQRWEDIRTQLSSRLLPAKIIENDLRAAGAATTPEEIGLTPDQMREAILNARYLRSRYTVLDFAADLGMLALFVSQQFA